jgi:hypothetical protein
MASEIPSCLLSYFPHFLLQADNNPPILRNNPALLNDKEGLLNISRKTLKYLPKSLDIWKLFCIFAMN